MFCFYRLLATVHNDLYLLLSLVITSSGLKLNEIGFRILSKIQYCNLSELISHRNYQKVSNLKISTANLILNKPRMAISRKLNLKKEKTNVEFWLSNCMMMKSLYQNNSPLTNLKEMKSIDKLSTGILNRET